ncbi:uncharacterized protein LOC117245926 isoform X4 [Epinephelus lanceolatus]
MMKRNLSPHSFIKDTLNRWKQKQRERTVEEQNQPGTQIQIHIYNLRLMTVMIGRRPENLSQHMLYLKVNITHQRPLLRVPHLSRRHAQCQRGEPHPLLRVPHVSPKHAECQTGEPSSPHQKLYVQRELAPLKHLNSMQSDSVPIQLPSNELAPLKHLRSVQSDSVPTQLPINELAPLKHLRSVQSDSVPTQLPINELAPLKHLRSVQSDSVPTQLPINELAPLKHLRSVQSDSMPTQLPIKELVPQKNLCSVQSDSVLMLLHTEQHSTIKGWL